MADSFSDRLRKVRLDRNLTQAVISEKAKLSKVQYSRYERGAALPTSEVLARVAKVLEISADYLLYGEEQPESAEATIKNLGLLKKFRELEQLPDSDRQIVEQLIEAFLVHRKVKDLALR